MSICEKYKKIEIPRKDKPDDIGNLEISRKLFNAEEFNRHNDDDGEKEK